eukprot:CAMPEP_0115848242 /NCGR_PEP_ID=MMETSP0287-20121206/10815_1 /TAXON_ID=412157 /ORGANISM="Chrysochromulina rotalis, Strain UIO044" /LENGTH=110 /DNA_ID=CAMNT_0003302137 /DNA_START=1400 /DNA_END=1729 /DNA_ORIENTATION=-
MGQRKQLGPTRPTDPHSSTPIPTDPKRSPQSLIAPRRESPTAEQSSAASRRAIRISPQQIKAAPRRAGQSHGGVAGLRGIGRGISEDSFAPTQPPSPPPVRCECAGAHHD